MLVIHPYIHIHDKSWYPFPFNYVMQDYEGHVKCHHVTGLCMSSLPFTGNIHDVLLFLHGQLYKFGVFKRLTFGEDLLNYSLHCLLAGIAYFYLWAAVKGTMRVEVFLAKKLTKLGFKKEKGVSRMKQAAALTPVRITRSRSKAKKA